MKSFVIRSLEVILWILFVLIIAAGFYSSRSGWFGYGSNPIVGILVSFVIATVLCGGVFTLIAINDNTRRIIKLLEGREKSGPESK